MEHVVFLFGDYFDHHVNRDVLSDFEIWFGYQGRSITNHYFLEEQITGTGRTLMTNEWSPIHLVMELLQ